jgi:hypothetical protein
MTADEAGDVDRVPQELPLIVGAGAGEPETLVLIGAPRQGRVVLRRWSSAAWGDSAAPREEDAAAFLRWVEAQAASGRTLNQALYAVRLWLRGEGTAPRSR